VPAGFDRFAPRLIEQYLAHYAESELRITLRELLALGRRDPNDDAEPFNMAYLAMRGSGAINGVSRLHGEVSRQIFLPLFPRWPRAEVPVGHITNGVHTPSWDSAEADGLWTSSCGKTRWRGTLDSLGDQIRTVSDSALWQFRKTARSGLVEYARQRLSEQLAASGGSEEEVEAARGLFRPDVLTLGFARRFATYKRPNLLLRDPERLARLLTDPQKPVQLILAGKAHPDDGPGQALIRDWITFIRRNDIRPHAIFLSDYDMRLTENLVQGVDVWMNTPQRPWEACGTSGMKVLVNGGLNLSELDGWWAEAYAPELGWALGDGREHDGDPAWDAVEASRLFDLLEQQVIPEFYSRDGDGIPRAWIARVRESMAKLTPAYSANRAVREYVEQCYLPAAAAYRERAENRGAKGAQIANWQRELASAWPGLNLVRVTVETHNDRHRFTAEVVRGSLDVQALSVQLYADPPLGGSEVVRQEMVRLDARATGTGADLYVTEVPASRANTDYTVRIVPAFPGVNVPLEAAFVRWQR
jgi:starch phosphorylase